MPSGMGGGMGGPFGGSMSGGNSSMMGPGPLGMWAHGSPGTVTGILPGGNGVYVASPGIMWSSGMGNGMGSGMGGRMGGGMNGFFMSFGGGGR